MPVNGYRCAFEFYNADFGRLGRQTVAVDLEPARECARFELLRRGPVPPDGSIGAADPVAPADPGGPAVQAEPGRVVPRWSAKLGAPYIEGFRIEFGGACPTGVDFPNAYFKDVARRAAERYVTEGALRAQESFHYLVMLFPAEEEEPVEEEPAEEGEADRRLPLTVRRQLVPLPLVESSLERHQAGAWLAGVRHRADVPVFLPAGLLREVKDLTRSAGGSECGGVLLGHVHRDRALPELFVDVTVQVPARHGESSADRLTFTPATWRDVDAARAQRARGEIMVGWWHSHPVGSWCQDCSSETHDACTQLEGFLSAHDRHLQRTVFPGAHCVALVVTDLGDREPNCTLFGWRHGQLARRGYFIRSGAALERRRRGRATQKQRTQPEGVQHGSAYPT